MEITKKEMNFYNDKILTISENGKVYVSVKDICKNLGMSKVQTDTQRNKINNDATLKGAGIFPPP